MSNTDKEQAEKQKPSRRKKFLKFVLIKFPIILLVLGVVFYATLKLVERYPVPLREGLEEYATSAFGANASIGKLNKFTFVPNVDIDIEDVTLHRINNAAQIDLEIDAMRISLPFWSAFFGLNKFKKFEIENVISDAGVVLPKSFAFDRIYISDKEGPEQFGSFVIASGAYDQKDFNLDLKIQKVGGNYKVPSEIPFVLSVGDMVLNGTIERNLRNVTLINGVFDIAGEKADLDDYVLVKSNEYTKNNPLSCILTYADQTECKKYLN